ncbi:hypothetical protein JX265_008346 [Neoarthrinium moseri]|uniref:DUF1996 domain-containing protein n=1 Tax=Neoarthrinium moseri TaxID=1658444 RepID=A0A9P9WI59_9PEZI|nr:uncharacterized protein JN550_011335 [Neoarthrinium moseri]KAI1860734.1 hypothetical protein JN550_011335 [Neoarthrinium moseri]KAI1864622.1 hypothetical protein JX265_008346 [Neoarthrinium moseri]
MYWRVLPVVALAAPTHALIRMGCSQLVVQRLDPLVTPGQVPSPHVHQIIGGNSLNATMHPSNHDIPKMSTCTTCQAADDFSNYWTAVLYFKAQNGTYKRVNQKGNAGFEGQKGGMTVYYMQNQLADYEQKTQVTAFKPGFRMFVGDLNARTLEEAKPYRQLTYTCLQDMSTRYPETKYLPNKPCPAGIMVNVRFPTCWDGVNLDSPNHMDHVSYPANGTFESQGPCPTSHPVKIPQLMFEVIFDTAPFNNKADWPTDGTQPFMWSFGDTTGYGTHGDYVFGWKDDSLQKIMNEPCYVNCKSMKTQTIDQMNSCTVEQTAKEDMDSWVKEIPGQAMTEE